MRRRSVIDTKVANPRIKILSPCVSGFANSDTGQNTIDTTTHAYNSWEMQAIVLIPYLDPDGLTTNREATNTRMWYDIFITIRFGTSAGSETPSHLMICGQMMRTVNSKILFTGSSSIDGITPIDTYYFRSYQFSVFLLLTKFWIYGRATYLHGSKNGCGC